MPWFHDRCHHILATQHLGFDYANGLITLVMGVPIPWQQKGKEKAGGIMHNQPAYMLGMFALSLVILTVLPGVRSGGYRGHAHKMANAVQLLIL